MTAKKPHPDNFGWSIINGGTEAEKTVAFGNGPLKTHRLYGADEAALKASIKAFEERLKEANGG